MFVLGLTKQSQNRTWINRIADLEFERLHCSNSLHGGLPAQRKGLRHQ